jgi:hypothetical protein
MPKLASQLLAFYSTCGRTPWHGEGCRPYFGLEAKLARVTSAVSSSLVRRGVVRRDEAIVYVTLRKITEAGEAA